MATQLTPVTDPRILDQLNAPVSDEVTDPALLAKLNSVSSQYPGMGESSALGAFGRAAVSTPVQMLLNAGHSLENLFYDPNITKAVYEARGATPPASNPLTAANILPSSLVPNAGDKYFPVSQFLGRLTGGLGLGAATDIGLSNVAPDIFESSLAGIGAGRPLITKLMNAAKSGAIQGGAYSQPGLKNTVEGSLTGALAAPALLLGAKGVVSGVKGIGNTAQQIKSFIEANPTELQSNLDAAKQAADTQNTATTMAKLQAGGSPEATAIKIGNTKSQIDNLQNQMNAIQDAPDIPEIAQLFKAGSTPDMRDTQANRMVIGAQSDLDRANQEQADNLGAGQSHAVRLGTALKSAITNIRDSFKPRYQQVEDDLYGLKVTNPAASSSNSAQSTVQDMLDSLPSNYADENGDLVEALQSQGKQPQQISGAQLLQMNRAANSAYHSALGKGNAYGVGSDVQAHWREKAANIKKLADSSRAIMEDELPQDTLSDYDQIQSDYGNQVMPFYRNGAFQMIDKEGKVPSNFIDKTSGNQDHQVIMQQLIKSDPELTRLAIGQKYAANPSKLLNWSENDEPYIQNHTKTAILRANQLDASDNLQRAKNIRDINSNLYPDQQDVFSKRQKLAQQIQDANSKLSDLEQAHTNHLAEIEKNQNTQEKLKQAQQENDNYLKTKAALKSKVWRAAGGGLAYYALHRELWDLLSKL